MLQNIEMFLEPVPLILYLPGTIKEGFFSRVYLLSYRAVNAVSNVDIVGLSRLRFRKLESEITLHNISEYVGF